VRRPRVMHEHESEMKVHIRESLPPYLMTIQPRYACSLPHRHMDGDRAGLATPPGIQNRKNYLCDIVNKVLTTVNNVKYDGQYTACPRFLSGKT
jgi:hypothetical protein